MAEATRLEPVLQRPHIEEGLRGTYEEFGFLQFSVRLSRSLESFCCSLIVKATLAKVSQSVKLFLKKFMVGKPGTAPGLPVPKTGGLLLSHIPMKYLNEAFCGVPIRT